MPPAVSRQPATLQLRQQLTRVSGSAVVNGREVPLEDVKLRGDRLSFKLAGRKGEFTGQVKGSSIEARSTPAARRRRGAPRSRLMQRKRVNSSKVRSVGYDEKTRTLEVEMSNGRSFSTAASTPRSTAVHGAPNATTFFDDKIAEEYSAGASDRSRLR